MSSIGGIILTLGATLRYKAPIAVCRSATCGRALIVDKYPLAVEESPTTESTGTATATTEAKAKTG